MRFKQWPLTALLAAAAALALAACGSSGDDDAASGATSNGSGGGQVEIEVVTHGQASTPFWAVVKNGVDDAAEAMGADVNYQAPQTFDMVAMSRLIDAAVAKKPDGLVVSIPDPRALGPSIRKAVQAGIPVVSINSGTDVYSDLGALTHIGQEEYEAGYQGGERMAEAGVTDVLCLNGEVGNAALDQRCAGFADALAESGGATKEIAVKLTDPNYTKQTTQAAIASNDPDGIFNTTNAVAIPALEAVKAAGKEDDIVMATFDLGPDELEAVERGEMLFAIDQQQYLQGYLPIVYLSLHERYGVMPGNGGITPTGPAFVTKDNAAQVIELSEQSLR